MRKKTMQALFFSLFIIGVFVGFLIPGDLMELSERNENPLRAGVFDVAKRMGQLNEQGVLGKMMRLGQNDDVSLQLVRIEDNISLGTSDDDLFLYVFKGKAKVTLNDVATEANPGQIVIIPEGMSYSIERVGEGPLEVVVILS